MSNENQDGLFSCNNLCWITGALFGLAGYLIFSGRFGWSTLLSLILALALLVLVAWLLKKLFCIDVPEGHHTDNRETRVALASDEMAEMDRVEREALATVPDLPKVATLPDPLLEASEVLGEEEQAAAEAEAQAKAEAEAQAKAEAEARARQEADAREAAERAKAAEAAEAAEKARKAATRKAAAKPGDAVVAAVEDTKARAAAGKKTTTRKTAAKTASKPAARPVAKDGKPELLTKPRGGKADDLKQIKGVGPKLEKLLNKLGVYHFDQVAGWRKKEVEWVDEHLEGFKGRVSRDEWVKQAKVLARGGETEFSNRVKKGKVY